MIKIKRVDDNDDGDDNDDRKDDTRLFVIS